MSIRCGYALCTTAAPMMHCPCTVQPEMAWQLTVGRQWLTAQAEFATSVFAPWKEAPTLTPIKILMPEALISGLRVTISTLFHVNNIPFRNLTSQTTDAHLLPLISLIKL